MTFLELTQHALDILLIDFSGQKRVATPLIQNITHYNKNSKFLIAQ